MWNFDIAPEIEHKWERRILHLVEPGAATRTQHKNVGQVKENKVRYNAFFIFHSDTNTTRSLSALEVRVCWYEVLHVCMLLLSLGDGS